MDLITASEATISEFNSEFKLPFPVGYPLFSTAVNSTIELITKALGSSDPLAELLNTNPPLPMSDKTSWNTLYGSYNSVLDPQDKPTLYIRPDLVFAPVFMMCVIAHEGTHALDPEVTEATKFAQCFKTLSIFDAEYGPATWKWTRYDLSMEDTAIKGELRVLKAASCPDYLLPEQKQYFNEQLEANTGNRNLQLHVNEVRRIGLTAFEFGMKLSNGEVPPSIYNLCSILMDHSVANSSSEVKWVHNTSKIIGDLKGELKKYYGTHRDFASARRSFDRWSSELKDHATAFTKLAPISARQIRPALELATKI